MWAAAIAWPPHLLHSTLVPVREDTPADPPPRRWPARHIVELVVAALAAGCATALSPVRLAADAVDVPSADVVARHLGHVGWAWLLLATALSAIGWAASTALALRLTRNVTTIAALLVRSSLGLLPGIICGLAAIDLGWNGVLDSPTRHGIAGSLGVPATWLLVVGFAVLVVAMIVGVRFARIHDADPRRAYLAWSLPMAAGLLLLAGFTRVQLDHAGSGGNVGRFGVGIVAAVAIIAAMRIVNRPADVDDARLDFVRDVPQLATLGATVVLAVALALVAWT